MKKVNKLDQAIIDAYENYVWNVNEAVRFVEMGSGSKVFEILKPILKQHEKDRYKKIEQEMNKKENN